MEFKDYYNVLGVKKDADAKAIKTAYRKLARKYHPDMNPEEGAETKFKEIAEAYRVLKSTQLRAEFDELLQQTNQSSQGNQPPPGWKTSSNSDDMSSASFSGDYSEFFNSIFGAHSQSFDQSGHRQSRSVRGQDIEVELPIFLEETLKETFKEVEFALPKDSTHEKQPKKHLKVKIPQGVVDGERIRLRGQGTPGFRGGIAGDLYLHIRLVPHPLFDVSGQDILITLPLAPWEAALGARVTVPTLDGKISLLIPPNTQSGKKFRIKGKGLKSKTKTGDLFAIVKIVLPAASSEKANGLWRDLAVSEQFDPRKEWSEQS